MAKFTSTKDLNLSFEGHKFAGPAGTVFRLPDSLQGEFNAVYGTRIPFTWIVVDEMTASGGAHPDLAAHDALGLSTDAELTAHINAGDPHVLYALDADLANHEADTTGVHGIPDTANISYAGHTHGGGASLPAGLIVMWGGAVTAIPAGWLLCDGANGTPDLRSRFIKGAAAGSDPGATGGATTHTHASHGALVHAGTIVADHASHTHTYTQVPNHVHVENINTATTGGAVGFPALADASTSGSTATGLSTANPTGGVATGTTAGPGAALTHAVTQPNDHAAQSHDSPNSEPPYYALCFIQKS